MARDGVSSLLLDGDEANNNGNWQWISSVGVDPLVAGPTAAASTTRSSAAAPRSGRRVRPPLPELEDVLEPGGAADHPMSSSSSATTPGRVRPEGGSGAGGRRCTSLERRGTGQS